EPLEALRKRRLDEQEKVETKSLAFEVQKKSLDPVPAEVVKKLRKMADLHVQIASVPAKPMDPDKDRLEKDRAAFLKEFEAKEPEKQAEKNLEQARAVLAAAVDDPLPTKASLEFLAGLLPKEAEKLYAEAAMLRRLSTLEAMPPWPAKAVGLALLA